MTTVPARRSPPWDTYRFGDGPEPQLQPGTLGWSASDLKEPWVRRLWDEGRYEILDGVLTRMPAAYFRGGSVVHRLMRVLHDYFTARDIVYESSGEVDIEIDPNRVVRADAAIVVANDLKRFASLTFEPPNTDWQDNPLTLPPTIVIESVSRGHELHDRRTKREWYGEFGVPNYWIIDAYQRSLECLLLKGEEFRVDQAGQEADQLTPFAFPELTIPLAQLWGPLT